MGTPDLLGHIGYVFLLAGLFLLSRKKTIGWLFRIIGDLFWVTVGFLLGMSAIWFWCLVFLCLDIYGYISWKKKQNTDTISQ